MSTLKLLQLPVVPPAYYADTGNVPLAAGSLAIACEINGLKEKGLEIEVIDPDTTDQFSDERLIESIANSKPDFLGLSLYLWNSERSLYIGRQVQKKSPDTKIIIGGPEVNSDNPFVLEEEGYDFAISGEAEDIFPFLLDTLLNKQDFQNIPGLAFRGPDRSMSKFTPQSVIDFPLNKFPSPYLNDILKVNPNRSTYLETVRGCRSQCTYCFYPKSSNTLRSLSADDCRKLFITLKNKGARELVFLDPTFNHRPGFEEILDILIDINSDKQMKMFAELRSEGITPHLVHKMQKAGFYRIELGMQSINKETLARVKRYGNPLKVAEVGKLIDEAGIELLLDLIIGLPGDRPEDVLKGVEFFKENNLEKWVQVFPLSILPGTAMRADASREGLVFFKKPPYRIIETPLFSPEQLIETLFEAEDILDRRIDETVRSHLVEPDNLSGDSRIFHTEKRNTKAECLAPSNRHFALWIESNNFPQTTNEILDLIQIKITKNPYSVLDVIVKITDTIPEILLDKILQIFENAESSYIKLALSLRDEDLQHRLVLNIPENSSVEKTKLKRWETKIPVYHDMTISNFIKIIRKKSNYEHYTRILDETISSQDWEKLKEFHDPELISFSSRVHEKKWTLEVLGYGE